MAKQTSEAAREARLRILASQDSYMFHKVRESDAHLLPGIAYYLAHVQGVAVVARYPTLESAEEHLALPEAERWTYSRFKALTEAADAAAYAAGAWWAEDRHAPRGEEPR